MARTAAKAIVLFAGPEDGLVVTIDSSDPCPQPGYHRTNKRDRQGRTVYEWRPETQDLNEEATTT